MAKKISWLIAAALLGFSFSWIAHPRMQSLGEERLGTDTPAISVTAAEIVEETDNSLRVRYYLHNWVDGIDISACGDVSYASDAYSWGCTPVIVPAYSGHVEITYRLASIAREIECSDSVGVRLYIGHGYSFYQHLFSYHKVWHKHPGAESWRTYQARGCEPPRPVSELKNL